VPEESYLITEIVVCSIALMLCAYGASEYIPEYHLFRSNHKSMSHLLVTNFAILRYMQVKSIVSKKEIQILYDNAKNWFSCN
jgi:hypothetical protein